jgi:hypothetical protein
MILIFKWITNKFGLWDNVSFPIEFSNQIVGWALIASDPLHLKKKKKLTSFFLSQDIYISCLILSV